MAKRQDLTSKPIRDPAVSKEGAFQRPSAADRAAARMAGITVCPPMAEADRHMVVLPVTVDPEAGHS